MDYLRFPTFLPSKLLKVAVILSGLLIITPSAHANSNSNLSPIYLKSCKIDIQADRIDSHTDSVDYYGNVQFLYGLANVKTDRVTLVKNKDGSCMLIANTWNGKNPNN